jgi:hypothetical protein
MKKQILSSIVQLFTASLLAQDGNADEQVYASREKNGTVIKIPMDPSSWKHDGGAVEFVMHRNVMAARPKGNGYQIFLKDHVFANGTIEFDVELMGIGFPGINFRMSGDHKAGENFYIRSFGPTTPENRTTLQYAAIIDGLSIWDLSDEYQAGATVFQEGWNHVKLVVSGSQMKAYVNDMSRPALIVPELEGRSSEGFISLSGNVIYANLTLKPGATEGLAPEPGYVSTYNDPRFLRKWQVSPPIDFPFGKDLIMPLPSVYGTLTKSELPDNSTDWAPIKAEGRSIINLSRVYGGKENDARRLAWLKTTIQSDKAQERVLSLGFSDEVWVFLNGQLQYADKNYFGTPSQKPPKGRCTVENSSIKLPLQKGRNEIMIAVANHFFGWGIVARMDDTDDGIHFEK